MAHRIKAIMRKRLVLIMIMLFLFPALTQTIQIAHGQTGDQWALSFSILNAQNVASSTFTPFDQIQLVSTVTYGNATVPDILVTFKVQGPTNSANPTNVTTIATTNATGVANSSLRLPGEAQNATSLVGTWQATATIQTTNGTLQQTLSFITQWNCEITSISIQNQQGQNQTIFYAGNTVKMLLTIDNTGQPLQANITINMQDSSGEISNQTQIENTQIGNSSTSPTQIPATLQIPDGSITGEATINAAIYSGTYQGIDLPAGENQTAYFTIATNTAPTTTPTPTPHNTSQNSVSLFSWLLIAIGLFTFTSLLVFLKRKPAPIASSQTPILAPSTTTSETATPASGQSTAPQEAPTPKIAQEKVIEATVMSGINLNQTPEPQPKFAATIEVGKPDSEPTVTQEPVAQATFAELGRISGTAKRIQAIKATLKSAREQLTHDITELNRLLSQQEMQLKNYFDKVREEMEKAKMHLTDIEVTADETAKLNLTPNLAQEPTSQAILTYRKRIASTEKRIQALTIALKLEKEQLAQDLTEFNQQVDEHQKTLNNNFSIVRQEIEKLQTYLTDKED